MSSEKDRQGGTPGEPDSQSESRDSDEMTDRELDDVSGGRMPVPDTTKKPSPPSGPVPVPYPNVT